MLRTLPLAAASVALASIAAPAVAQIPPAHYICFYGATPLPLLNFTITGPGQYTDAGGNRGSFRDSGGGQFVFSGGNFDGQKFVFQPGSPPTISIIGPSGSQNETCQPGNN